MPVKVVCRAALFLTATVLIGRTLQRLQKPNVSILLHKIILQSHDVKYKITSWLFLSLAR